MSSTTTAQVHKMKKLLLIATFFIALCTSANASILLTTPFNVTGPAGIAAGPALYATMISHTYDGPNNTVCLIYAFGTTTQVGGYDQSFAVLPGAPTVSFCTNLTTGVWSATASTGVTLNSGVLTGPQLTAAQPFLTGALLALKDAADDYACCQIGLFLPGTQPYHWSVGGL